MFVLYKMSLQQATPWDDENNHDIDLSSKGNSLLQLSLEALLKTQKDDVRINCVGWFSCPTVLLCTPLL